jgi:O-antigen/teichoic acid export membrane protein
MIKNGLYNLIGASFRLGLTVATIPLLIRLIGLEEYGLWTLVSTVVTIVTLAESGLSVSTTFFLSKDLGRQDKHDISKTLTISSCCILTLATLSSLLLWYSSQSIVWFFPRLTDLQLQIAIQSFQLGSFVVWAKLLQRFFVGIEQAFKNYGFLNFINTLQTGITNIGMLWIAYTGGRTLDLMKWQVISNFAILVVHVLVSHFLLKCISLRFIWDSQRCMEIFRYSTMTWLTSVGSALFTQGDKVIVGSIIGTHLLGVYAAITSVASQINAFSSFPVQPLLPELSQLLSSTPRKDKEIISLVRQAFHVNVVIATGLGGALIILGPMLLPLLLSQDNLSEYIKPFYLAILIYTVYSANAVGYYVLFSTNNVGFSFKIQILAGILSLILIAYGTSAWGVWGAVLGNSGYILIWLLTTKSMEILNIPHVAWLRWISFVFGWFAIISSLAIITPNLIWMKIPLLILYLSVLGFWFFLMHRSSPKLIREQ